jgi:hypothetical protein
MAFVMITGDASLCERERVLGTAVTADPEHCSLIDSELKPNVSTAIVVVGMAIASRGNEMVGESTHVVRGDCFDWSGST